ncbi:hypothetical protein [Thioalkalivibrio sp. ALE16]|uniref:hypothetical protein n=1 Tax=Thioalkalivibrio sp. ALE16 TaxID=1158172 RepID=UPI00035C21F1|nr:hypothetical protein [Thioalkalivibrio sp. ALE16]
METINDISPAILIVGNPVDGLSHIGPFADTEAANEYGDGLDEDWWVVTLAAPEIEDAEETVRTFQTRLAPEDIPDDFEVRPLQPGDEARDKVTCLSCGLSWDDAVPTGITPAPAARCPFEPFHRGE